MGIGGRIGNGKQWTSWIALDDVVSAVRFTIYD
jgi:NAD dependent epimerase/dehydratase family enzyme